MTYTLSSPNPTQLTTKKAQEFIIPILLVQFLEVPNL